MLQLLMCTSFPRYVSVNSICVLSFLSHPSQGDRQGCETETVWKMKRDILGKFALSLSLGSSSRNSTAFPLWREVYQITLLFVLFLQITTVNWQGKSWKLWWLQFFTKRGERLWWSFADKPYVPTRLVRSFETEFHQISTEDDEREFVSASKNCIVWVILRRPSASFSSS